MKNKLLQLVLCSVFLANSISYAVASKGYRKITVKRGETLAIIAKKYLSDPSKWRELLKYNKIKNPNYIKVGMQIKVPDTLGKKPFAFVSFKIGKSKFKRKGATKWKKTSLNLGLYENDSIETFKRSKLYLTIGKKSKIKISPNSMLILRKAIINKNKAILYLRRGGLQSSIKGLFRNKGRSDFRIVTPASVAAVRGTEFTTQINKSGDSSFAVYGGQVNVSAEKHTVKVMKGYSVFVKKGQVPNAPIELPPPPEIVQ